MRLSMVRVCNFRHVLDDFAVNLLARIEEGFS